MKTYDGSSTPTHGNGDRVSVGIGELVVATDGANLISTGLGSCVGVALYDPPSGTRGMVHVMLPEQDGRDPTTPGKFADTGVRALIDEVVSAGASRGALEARIAGGSDMLDLSNTGEPIGQRNISAVRDVLERLDVPIVGENLGGDYGRTIEFQETGELIIKTANGDRHSLS